MKKSSVFTKIFVPIMIIMLAQAVFISTFLFASGTISTLRTNSIEVLNNSTMTRQTNLEHAMNNYWSNVSTLEYSVLDIITNYLYENELDINQVLGDDYHELVLLDNMSDALLESLGITATTGIFMYFLPVDRVIENPETVNLNGLYYRSARPFIRRHNGAGIVNELLLVRGPMDIARKYNMPTDSLWSSRFTFNPNYESTWNSFIMPQIAFDESPEFDSSDLSYWSVPHVFTPWSPRDANRQITYTRPIILDGQMIAMIGTEMQTVQLESFFPARDLETFRESGYMLVRIDAPFSHDDGFLTTRAAETSGTLSAEIMQITGAFMNRLLEHHQTLTLESTYGYETYIIAEHPDVHLIIRPLHLYNTNALFNNETWALVAMGTERALFEIARNVTSAVHISTAVACVSGGILLFIVAKNLSKPLKKISNQIKQLENGDDLIYASNVSEPVEIFNIDSKTREIDLLCSTLNEMISRRALAEMRTFEEHQRYLFALECSTDTFMEYNIESDIFSVYYFTAKTENAQVLSTKKVKKFSKILLDFVHPDDLNELKNRLNQKAKFEMELRIKYELAKPIVELRNEKTESDNGYFWFSIKMAHIENVCVESDQNIVTIETAENNSGKKIGSAKEITQQKLEEFAKLELSRRDLTTGLYNCEYGLQLLKKQIANTEKTYIYILRIKDFAPLEMTYGQVFAGVFIHNFAHEILRVLSNNDLSDILTLRLSNNEILLQGELDDSIIEQIENAFAKLYKGEKSDVEFGLQIECVENNVKNIEKISFSATNESMPVNVHLDLNNVKQISHLSLELFERTLHLDSAIQILIGVIARQYNLKRVVVCTYDNNFGTRQITHQWYNKEKTGLKPLSDATQHVPTNDFKYYKNHLCSSGTLVYKRDNVDNESDDKQLWSCLCFPEKNTTTFCCETYENAENSGRILYIAPSSDSEIWDNKSRNTLHSVTKIIATYANAAKMHSASRAKSMFLSKVSHEIRTPMNAIIGFTNIALETIHSGDDFSQVSEHLSKISSSANYLLELINEILEMSRIESGKTSVVVVNPFSIQGLMKDVETIMRLLIEERGIIFETEQIVYNDNVYGDYHKLKQVLINLVGNANKFTKPGGTITLSVIQLGSGNYLFAVKDTGVGIPYDKQETIFNPFEQVATTVFDSQSGVQGTGLGLTITKNILQTMQSKIELRSAPGEGAVFSFVVNLREPDTHEITPQKLLETIVKAETENNSPTSNIRAIKNTIEQTIDSFTSQNEQKQDKIQSEFTTNEYTQLFKGKRLLVVDDVSTNVYVITSILEQVGFIIESVYDGSEAVQAFTKKPEGYFDAILMDIQMPVMNGFDATRQIRKSEHKDARTIPIIAVTANILGKELKEPHKFGMNGHIGKPIKSNVLYECLHDLLVKGVYSNTEYN
ncbi:MAG: ATP-binding protein [Oscillospiraceae bacterium]|nr:ATP-binding protein [Oscillospiraceae bacterium]